MRSRVIEPPRRAFGSRARNHIWLKNSGHIRADRGPASRPEIGYPVAPLVRIDPARAPPCTLGRTVVDLATVPFMPVFVPPLADGILVEAAQLTALRLRSASCASPDDISMPDRGALRQHRIRRAGPRSATAIAEVFTRCVQFSKALLRWQFVPSVYNSFSTRTCPSPDQSLSANGAPAMQARAMW